MLNTLKNRNIFTYLSIVIVTIIYIGLLFNLINRHSVNVLFWDMWGFPFSIFENSTAWQLFSYQHGPHRQGLGTFVIYLVGSTTNWNTRAEAFCIGGILVLTAIAALYLKYRLFGKLTAWDSLIPVICLNFTQCEIAFPNTNPGYTALPLLLIILSGIVLTIEKKALRYSLLALVNFFAVFTGFSVFLGVIVPLILIFAIISDWLNNQRREMIFAVGALIVSFLTLALFFTNYRLEPAVDCFQFPHPVLDDYRIFISNLMTMSQGFISGYHVIFARRLGQILFALWIIVLLHQFWLIIKTKNSSVVSSVIFLFLSFSLVYAVNTAIGRVCLGTEAARATRYMTLLIPGWLAIYFSILLLKSNILRISILVVFIVLFVVLPLLRYGDIDNTYTPLTLARQKWVACYRERENIEECDETSGTKVYPDAKAMRLKEKLDFLKQHQYNLFLEPASDKQIAP